MIYIIRSKDKNAYKIGYTDSLNSRIRQIQNGSAGGDKSCKLVHAEDGSLRFEKQILNELEEYKFEYSNNQEWVKCSLKTILTAIENIKIENDFKEKQIIFLEDVKVNLQKILSYSKKDFKVFLPDIISNLDKNKHYLNNKDLYQLLYQWIDYKVLFYKHVVTFIENIDFFVPNSTTIEKNLWIFAKNIFTIKLNIQKEIEDKLIQTKYLDILNKKIYINKDTIAKYIEVNELKANEYWKIKNKVDKINENIELVQLSLMFYNKNSIKDFVTKIKTVN